MKTLIKPLALGLVLSLGLQACASGQQDEALRSAERRMEDYRIVDTRLRAHPMASLVERDLTRVEAWLQRAEIMLNDEDRDPEQLDLLLQVIEGQLVQTKAQLSALDAEQQLETQRAAYEQRAGQLRRRQEATAQPPKEGSP